MLDLLPRLKRLIEMIVIPQLILRGGRPAWSTAVGLGPIPYRFAGSNPAPRITLLPFFGPKIILFCEGKYSGFLLT